MLFSYFCCCTAIKLCPTLFHPMDCSPSGSLSFTISRSLLSFISTELVKLPNHLILCQSLLLLFQFFPASRSFPMNPLFTSGSWSIIIFDQSFTTFKMLFIDFVTVYYHQKCLIFLLWPSTLHECLIFLLCPLLMYNCIIWEWDGRLILSSANNPASGFPTKSGYTQVFYQDSPSWNKHMVGQFTRVVLTC